MPLFISSERHRTRVTPNLILRCTEKGLSSFLMMQAEAKLRTVFSGQQKHTWDFRDGPLQIDLKILACHYYHQSASLCCETGTSLHLLGPNTEGTLPRQIIILNSIRHFMWVKISFIKHLLSFTYSMCPPQC